MVQKYAALHKIPFVMYGEHPSEYGDRIDEAFEPKMREHYFVDDTNIDNLILGGESARKICTENNFNISDMSDYLPVKPSIIKELDISVTI